jgi:diketogulonate reductase-like aldo/keto reductase
LEDVRESVEGSIKRLGFVPDLFLIHNPFIPKPGELKALWKQLETLKDEGKLKSIGVSNFRVQDLKTVLEVAKYKPVVNQVITSCSIPHVSPRPSFF